MMRAAIVDAFLKWAETARVSDRAKAANALARVYLDRFQGESERQSALMALTWLLDDPSPKVRLALAEALAPSEDAPRSLILTLAADQPEIACTVIALSPLLTDTDLVDLAAAGDVVTRGLIAARPGLSAVVTAALAEIAESAVIADLLDVPSMPFTQKALRAVASRLGHDASIRNRLLARDDLPAEARHRLMQAVTAALAGHDLVRAVIGERRAERLLRDAATLATVTIAGDAPPRDMPALVEHLRVNGQLTPAFLMHALCSGKVDFVAAVLVRLSGLEDGRVRAILSGGRPHALRALFEAAGLGRDISEIFVEATVSCRHAARRPAGSLVEMVSADLLRKYERSREKQGVVSELMDMVEKLGIGEQRARARSFALSSLNAA